MNKDMTIEDLARITGEQFAVVDGRLDKLETGVLKLEAGMQRLEVGLQKVLDVVLENPSKTVVEKLAHKVEDIDQRVVVLEQKAA